MPETSIIIRTKNEQKWIGKVLMRLSEQTYKKFEIIIVDSGSTDKTLEIAKKFDNVRIFQIKPEEFSYPFALNFGCRQALENKYFIFLSAHSLPISKTWIEDGTMDFVDDSIMGAYGFVWALPDGSIWEKLIFNEYVCKFRNFFKKKIIINYAGMGVLGFTNAIIRRDLWDKYNFNEKYGAGGEDGEWNRHWLKEGCRTVRDIKFSVYHSHGLGLKDLKKQFEYWKSTGQPMPFKFPKFRIKK